jgi:uncharacterized protein YbjQ (UPF0145 family)
VTGSMGMLVLTTETVAGHTVVETLGLVRGSSVRGVPFPRDLSAFMKNLVGGEIDEYTKLMAESREQAIDRMIAEALAHGADAILGLRFANSTITRGAAEVLAYGTAVRLRRDPAPGEG